MKELIQKLDIKQNYLKAMRLWKEIPENGIISVELASVLQTKCWLISCDLTAISTKAEVYMGKTKRQRDDMLNDKKTESESSSQAAKETDAKCTQDYRTLADEYEKAVALFNNITSLKKFFENGVYVMRSRQDKEAKDWQSTPPQEV